jgi:hypothetical protein
MRTSVFFTLKITFILIFSILFFNITQAQQRFKGGVVLGLTASQIDGDLSAGYNKLGLTSGFRVNARLKERMDASVEMLFSQRGAQSELIKDEFNPFNYSLTLNYIEVPVQWHYKDWLVEGDDASDNYYRVSFNAGLSYARFFGSRFKGEPNGISVVAADYLKKDDISFLLGANFFFNRHFGITFRYVRSIGLMYDARDWNPAPAARSWNGHCLYFQTCYLF